MYTYGDIHTHVQVDGYALITWLSMYFLGDSGIRFLVFTVLGRLKGPDISNILRTCTSVSSKQMG